MARFNVRSIFTVMACVVCHFASFLHFLCRPQLLLASVGLAMCCRAVTVALPGCACHFVLPVQAPAFAGFCGFGHVLGELSLLPCLGVPAPPSGWRHLASALAMAPVSCAVLDREAFIRAAEAATGTLFFSSFPSFYFFWTLIPEQSLFWIGYVSL